jgi:serine/threonine protein kinase
MISKEIEKAVFEAAVAIDDRELRLAFLDQACGGNAAQRRRLGSLLEAHDSADHFFMEAEEARTVVAAQACEDLTEVPLGNTAEQAAYFPDTSEDPGTWIGRYQILERIGTGGYGIVYLAEQQDPVQRLVALKVIRLGMNTESVIARFGIERQSLAAMDHPNIAHVLDAGATESGRPYFVMEWVQGDKITDYCNRHRLDIAQRIDLFIGVCHAIQHAHQKGVIHRDIKPSNILVVLHDGTPHPKVIDFGIAKATSGKSSDETLLTAHEHFVGTPAYMSPEQADRKGLDVDTRSDVYSLGVLLYELLTGSTPFDPKVLSAAGVLEMRRMLLELEPPTPSATLCALNRDILTEIAIERRSEPMKLISAVRGDLDWVVMKSLDKDRQRRYETVNGLIMDLNRFINNEAVRARPPSRLYLFQKFVRRNRLTVASTAGIAAALVLGLGLAYGSYRRERQARVEQARMKDIAEAARANEAKLRELSVTRENIALVAVLISEGKIEEADAQLQRTPLSTIEPSLEASNVLRSLGGWNAMRGRWTQASECFLLLTRANHLSNPEQIVSNTDLVAPGSAFVESGDLNAYNQFREWALSYFGNTSNALAAQQIIQTTLLLPAAPDFIQRLTPAKDLIESISFAKDHLTPGWNTEFAAWRSWSLSLLEYRRGNYQKAIYWSELSMSYRIPKNALYAAIHPVLAMAHYRCGDMNAATAEMNQARKMIQAAFTPELPPAYEPLGENQGYWWDWVQAQILFREAEALMRNSAASE